MRFLRIGFLAVVLSHSLWASRSGDLRHHTQTATSIVLGHVTEYRSYYATDGEIALANLKVVSS